MSERILRKRKPLADISVNVIAPKMEIRAGDDMAISKSKKQRSSLSSTETSGQIEIEVVPSVPVTQPPSEAQTAPTLPTVDLVLPKEKAPAPAPIAIIAAPKTIPSSSLFFEKRPSSAVAIAPPERERKCVFRMSKCPDPAQCLPILNDLYDHYYSKEVDYAVKPYMSRQEDINVKMRSILVDWLVEVHYKFKLQPQTLWLCINVIDRYLSQVVIPRAKLQLVGVCALFIACKFEEIFTPDIKDCIFITDYAYTKADLVAMESLILQQIDYQLFVPTGYHFLTRYLDAIAAAARTRTLAFYYAERLLQEQEILDYLPHHIAGAALYAALKQQQQHLPTSPPFAEKAKTMSCWNTILQTETGLTEAEVIPVARIIVTKVAEVSETASKRLLIAAKKKYTHGLAVSHLPLPTIA